MNIQIIFLISDILSLEMPSVKYLKIPAIPNFANLIVYPAPQGVSVLANFCNYNILILGSNQHLSPQWLFCQTSHF